MVNKIKFYYFLKKTSAYFDRYFDDLKSAPTRKYLIK